MQQSLIVLLLLNNPIRWMVQVFALFLALVPNSSALAASDTGITLTFAARPPQKPSNDHDRSWTGHAYLVIGVKTSTGIKEDILGFYPASNQVKGPGFLKAEYRCDPSAECGSQNKTALLKQLKQLSRLSETSESITVSITPEERSSIYKAAYKWDDATTTSKTGPAPDAGSEAEYRLWDKNCIDFLVQVARSIDFPTPDRGLLQNPVEFLKALKPLAIEADKARAEKRRADEAERRRKAAEEKQAEADSRAREAQEAKARVEAKARAEEAERRREEEEKNTIPAGWIPCQCPAVHQHLGKVVRGVLYHPPDVPDCPR